MKRNFKIKLLSLLGMSAMLVVPMVSLTSCGKVSQYFMPVIIGGEKIDNGPFKNFKDVIKYSSIVFSSFHIWF